MTVQIHTVDAFTDTPFRGNPAAVCLLERHAEELWMQHVAREMNLSETAFISPREDGFDLRWFTPVAEVDLCGHATLATAHTLFEERWLSRNEIARFYTKSGLLTVTQIGRDLEMDFPAEPAESTHSPSILAEALGQEALFTGRNRFDYLVELKNESAVRELNPDFTKLKSVETRGIIVTARAETAGIDFVSRFFCPRLGIDEDPVTGSAHCCLAPYWHGKLTKTEMRGYQASRRGGFVDVVVKEHRVLLRGRAVTVLRGELQA